MIGLDNLNAGISKLNSTINSVKALVLDLQSKSGDSDAAVQAMADAVNAANDSLALALPPPVVIAPTDGT